jgi:hypothetical protein
MTNQEINGLHSSLAYLVLLAGWLLAAKMLDTHAHTIIKPMFVNMGTGLKTYPQNEI